MDAANATTPGEKMPASFKADVGYLVIFTAKALEMMNFVLSVGYDSKQASLMIGIVQAFNNWLFNKRGTAILQKEDIFETLLENYLKLKQLNTPEIIGQVISQMSDKAIKQLITRSYNHLREYELRAGVSFAKEANIVKDIAISVNKGQKQEARFSFEMIKNDSRCARELDGLYQELLRKAMNSSVIVCLDQNNDMFAGKIGQTILDYLNEQKLDMQIVNFFAVLDYMYGSAGLGTVSFPKIDDFDYIDWRGLVANYYQLQFSKDSMMTDDIRSLSCLNFTTIGLLLQTLDIIYASGPLIESTELDLATDVKTEIYNYFDQMGEHPENSDPLAANRIVEETAFPYKREMFSHEKHIVQAYMMQYFFIIMDDSSTFNTLYVPYELLGPVAEYFEPTSEKWEQDMDNLLYYVYCRIAVDILEFVIKSDYEKKYGLTPFYATIDKSLAEFSVSLRKILALLKEGVLPQFQHRAMPTHLFHPAIFAILAIDQQKSAQLVNQILTTVLDAFARPKKYAFLGDLLREKIEAYITKQPRTKANKPNRPISSLNPKMWKTIKYKDEFEELDFFSCLNEVRLFSVAPSEPEECLTSFEEIECFIGKTALVKSKSVYPWLAVGSLVKMLPTDAGSDCKGISAVRERADLEKKRLYSTFSEQKGCDRFFSSIYHFVFADISDLYRDFVCVIADSYIYDCLVKNAKAGTLQFKKSLDSGIYQALTAYLAARPAVDIPSCRMSQIPADLTVYRCIAAIEHFQVKEFLEFVQLATNPKQLRESTRSAVAWQLLQQIVFLDLSTPEKKKFAHCVARKLLLNIKGSVSEAYRQADCVVQRFKYAYYVNGKRILAAAWRLYIWLYYVEQSENAALLDPFVEAVKSFGETVPSWKMQSFDFARFASLEQLICRSLECLDREGIRVIDSVWLHRELATEYSADRAEFKLFEQFLTLAMPTCAIDMSPEEFSTYFEASRPTNCCFAETSPCFLKYETTPLNKELIRIYGPTTHVWLFEPLLAYMFGWMLQGKPDTESVRLGITQNFLYFAYCFYLFILPSNPLYKRFDAILKLYAKLVDASVPLCHTFPDAQIYVLRQVLYYLSGSSIEELIYALNARKFFDAYQESSEKIQRYMELLVQRLLTAVEGAPLDFMPKYPDNMNSLLETFRRVFVDLGSSGNYVVLHNSIEPAEVECFSKRSGLILLYVNYKPTEVMKPPADPAYQNVADGRYLDAFAPVYYYPGQPTQYYAYTKTGNLAATQSTVYNYYALQMYSAFPPMAEAVPPAAYFPNGYRNGYYSTASYPFNAAGAPTAYAWAGPYAPANYQPNSGSDVSYQQLWNYYGYASNVSGPMGQQLEGQRYGYNGAQYFYEDQGVFYNPYGEFYVSRIKIYESYKVEDEEVLDMRRAFAEARSYFYAIHLLPLDAHKIFCIAKGLVLNTVLLPFSIPPADLERFMSLIAQFPVIQTKVSESIVDMNSPLFERHKIRVVSKPPHGLGEIILTPPLAHLLGKAGITYVDLYRIYREEDFVCELYLAVFKPRILLYPSRGGEVGGNVCLSCGCFVPAVQIVPANLLAYQRTSPKVLKYLLQQKFMCPNCRKAVFIAKNANDQKPRTGGDNQLSISQFGNASESSLILLVDGTGQARVDYLYRYGFFNQFLDYWL